MGRGKMRLVDGARALGFSLVEIAIVLVVIGLIVSGGLLGLSPVMQANKISQTNSQLDKIEQALVLYVIQNGCLPCPASASTLAGTSASTAATYSSGCSGSGVACAAIQGIVPWVNLGLSRSDVTDVYGSFMSYAVTTGTTNSSSLTNLSTSMLRTPPSTYPAGNLRVQNTSGTTQTSAAAYVLISHGSDGSFGYAASNGSQRTDPNSSHPQACNGVGQSATCTSGATITQTGYVQDQNVGRATAGNYLDDIVRFKTAPVIIQACGSNACGNPA